MIGTTVVTNLFGSQNPIGQTIKVNGFNFTVGRYHNTALDSREARQFKTPTLRNIALTGPYMHDGSVATLADAIDNYAAGGRAPRNPHKDARLRGFAITPQNKKDLIAFLETLH